ncbi:MAG: helix-turn-helix domain-containing protein [Planctomycetota bacterium]
MYQSPIDSDQDRDDSFFSQPSIVLLDQEHWLYLKKRYHLTARELQIARLVCRGLNNDQLARALRIRQKQDYPPSQVCRRRQQVLRAGKAPQASNTHSRN